MIFRKRNRADEELRYSFGRDTWKQFRRNRPAYISFYILLFMLFIGMFASFLANDQPLYASYRGKTFYPAFAEHWIAKSVFGVERVDSVQHPVTGIWERIQYDITDWRALELEGVIWPLIPFSSSTQDILNRNFVSPGDEHFRRNENGEVITATGKFRHRMGTDVLGRDVLAGIIHGTKISLLVGIVSMSIALLIGLLLGSLAGFFGDHRIRLSRIRLFLVVPGLLLAWFYAFVLRGFTISDAFGESTDSGFVQLFLSVLLFVLILMLIVYGGKFLEFGFFAKQVFLPVDSLISRGIEIFNSMPKLLLIITISAVIEERSIWLLMLIIGLSSWTEIARFVRAEMLKVRELEYVQAARSIGLSEWRIIVKHALPNAMAPVFIYVAFGIASAILVESGLSFLNIGVPDDVVTWGSMLNVGRTEPEAWWMIVYPGLAIFITVTVYNLIGEGLRDALDPRLRK
ncbi:MAG: ABC transporter permease [Flavobacteriales bacterium]